MLFQYLYDVNVLPRVYVEGMESMAYKAVEILVKEMKGMLAAGTLPSRRIWAVGKMKKPALIVYGDASRDCPGTLEGKGDPHPGRMGCVMFLVDLEQAVGEEGTLSPGYPDHSEYVVETCQVPATLIASSSSAFKRQTKNSTFSGECQAKVNAYEKAEGPRAHLEYLLGQEVPVIVLGDHLGLEETILRQKPPLDKTICHYVTWLREWVRLGTKRLSAWCPT